MKPRAQQEMVGFVLIVIIVIIAMMIFLVFYLRGGKNPTDSLEAQNMLGSIFKMTSECAPVTEPHYNSYETLFKTCYEGARCKNLNKVSCEYLKESLSDLLSQMMKSEATINYYNLDFYTKEGTGILSLKEGNCTGDILSAQKSISKGSETLYIRLKICKD